MTEEETLPVPDFPHYTCSKTGRVVRTTDGYEPQVSKCKGNPVITLSVPRKAYLSRQFTVVNLIARVWVPNPNGYRCAALVDPTGPVHADNIVWKRQHNDKGPKVVVPRGKKPKNRKKPKKERVNRAEERREEKRKAKRRLYSRVRADRGRGTKVSVLVERYDLSQPTISKICKGVVVHKK